MTITDRPTADVVVLILTVVAAASVLLVGVGLFALALVRPGTDVTAALEALAAVLTLLIGAVVGYLAGRGHSTPAAPPTMGETM